MNNIHLHCLWWCAGGRLVVKTILYASPNKRSTSTARVSRAFWHFHRMSPYTTYCFNWKRTLRALLIFLTFLRLTWKWSLINLKSYLFIICEYVFTFVDLLSYNWSVTVCTLPKSLVLKTAKFLTTKFSIQSKRILLKVVWRYFFTH